MKWRGVKLRHGLAKGSNLLLNSKQTNIFIFIFFSFFFFFLKKKKKKRERERRRRRRKNLREYIHLYHADFLYL